MDVIRAAELSDTVAIAQLPAHAEHFASTHYAAEKFAMVIVSSRIELISFHLRRGYQKTGTLMDYPFTAGVGIPKCSGLTVEILEKLVGIIQPDDKSITHTYIHMRLQ